MEQTPSLLDMIFGAMQHAMRSPYTFGAVIFFAVIGFLAAIENLRDRKRFDPTRHFERPPIEGKPARSLPPAGDYIEWERQQDKEKDGLPWN